MLKHYRIYRASEVALVVKNLSAKAGDTALRGLISELGQSPGEGKGTPFQYPCLKNPMVRGAWCYSPWSLKESDTTEVT